MSKEENKSLARRELEEIWTKGNLALVWGPVDRTWALIRPGSRGNGGEKMRPRRIHLASIALLLVFWASACAATNSESGTEKNSDRIQSEHLSTISAKDFERSNFDNSTTVDNKWFPLEPGSIPCSRDPP